MITFNIIKISLSFIVIECVYLLNYYFMLKEFKQKYPNEMEDVKEVGLGDMEKLIWGHLYDLIEEHTYWEVKVRVRVWGC